MKIRKTLLIGLVYLENYVDNVASCGKHGTKEPEVRGVF